MNPNSDIKPILIVDDNSTNLKVLSKTLTSAGFEIAVATNGERALKQVEYDPPELILLDVMMPGIDGFETCQRLKANPITQDIPVIFMTALSEAVDKVKGLSVGGVDYIIKPFEEEEVLARVRVHLQLRALSKTLADKNQQLSMTLEQLQAAQKQIIAREKLASLGTLTAGVAHEIRNPLNFVKNYAEGSLELVDELMEELENQSEIVSKESIHYIKELITDLRENAAAITRHSQRAESIIHNMMQHARTDRGQYQLTDLNGILNQALQLTYHSLRAKDGTFNVNVETDYDESIGQLELVSADICRAFINIIDNACYALREKYRSLGQEFAPTISIKTQNLGREVEIRIRDNGTGITSDIKEQIFNPFFTTKPTGEGTGLGLSLTHDIIVEQHQGMVKIETQPDLFTEFIILLMKNIAA